ncbi:MAG TPA: hypothetical protein VIM92_10520, partial [Rhodanobacteraceae bacterium]
PAGPHTVPLPHAAAHGLWLHGAVQNSLIEATALQIKSRLNGFRHYTLPLRSGAYAAVAARQISTVWRQR